MAFRSEKLPVRSELTKECLISLQDFNNKHIQLLHDRNNEWLLTFYSNCRAQVCIL